MSDDQGTPLPDTGIIFYQTEDGKSRIQVRLQDGTVWLNQRLLAELYQVAVPTINEHISTIYSNHERSPEATIRKFLIVQTDGSRQVERLVDFYNLDMILAIGNRMRTHTGVQFCRGVMERLQEYIVEGYVPGNSKDFERDCAVDPAKFLAFLCTNQAKAIIELLSDHTELFKQFSDNQASKKWLLDTIFLATYSEATG